MKKNFDPKKVYISKEYLEELEAAYNVENLQVTEMGPFDRCISHRDYERLTSTPPSSKIRKHVQKHNHYVGMARNMVVLSAMSEFQHAKRHAYDMVNSLQGRLVKVFGYDHGLLIGLGKTKDSLRVMVKEPQCLVEKHGWDKALRHTHFRFPDQVPKGGVWNWWVNEVYASGITKEVEVPALDVDLPDHYYNTKQ